MAKKSTAVEEVKKPGALAISDMEADAGQGSAETADSESFAIPFLVVLQGLSPQMETIEGAKLGLLCNTVSEELFEAAQIIPVAFQRRFIQWAPRSSGGGFRGMYTASEMDKLIEDGVAIKSPEGVGYVTTEGDNINDTRQHYVLILGSEPGLYAEALIAMASTQVKRSKRWMSQMVNWKIKGKNGLFNPPSFARIYTASSEKESNDQGTWYSWVIKPGDQLESDELYNAAKSLKDRVLKSKVKVDYDSVAEKEADTGF